jgi:DNA-directed RNA polymerase specialized sigma24 family protein
VPSEGSFSRLLAWLDAGVDSGGERYVDMRRRLSAYFGRRNCHTPDDLADETLNRIARRLEEEGTLQAGPPGRYCHIVAKFVFLEYTRLVKRAANADAAREARSAALLAGASADENDRQRRLASLERCLDRLPPRDRELILEYYGPGDQRTADRRRQLAARLGLTANALAIRACRIRDTLEGCVRSQEREP